MSAYVRACVSACARVLVLCRLRLHGFVMFDFYLCKNVCCCLRLQLSKKKTQDIYLHANKEDSIFS